MFVTSWFCFSDLSCVFPDLSCVFEILVVFLRLKLCLSDLSCVS